MKVTFKGKPTVRGLVIANGFQIEDRNGDAFLNNSRVKYARVQFSDRKAEMVRFRERQRGYLEVIFRNPHRIEWLKVVVDAVYPGSKWSDLAISELGVLLKR